MIWAIPDIHGRADLLTKLLWEMDNRDIFGVNPVVFLGDYVDRGPNSKEVLRLVKDRQDRFGSVYVLKGNHEQMMIDHLHDPEDEDRAYHWHINGSRATLISFCNAVPESIVSWLDSLIIKLELTDFETGKNFFFSHAPAPSEGHRNVVNKGLKYTQEELTWGAHNDERGYSVRFKDGTVGVCGHIHALSKGIQEPRFYEHYLFCDSGCGCNPHAPLVAVEVVSREILWARPEEL